MAFTNKRFSKDDKDAIIKKIVESKEIQDKLAEAITAKVDEALETAPKVSTTTEGDLVVTFKAGDVEKSYKLSEVAVAITEDEQGNITVFEDHPSPN